MKRKDLKPIELENNLGPDVNGVIHRVPWKAYDIEEVHSVMDGYEARIKELEEQLAHSNNNVDTMLDIANKTQTENANLEYENGVSNRHIKYLNNRIKELEEQLKEKN